MFCRYRYNTGNTCRAYERMIKVERNRSTGRSEILTTEIQALGTGVLSSEGEVSKTDECVKNVKEGESRGREMRKR